MGNSPRAIPFYALRKPDGALQQSATDVSLKFQGVDVIDADDELVPELSTALRTLYERRLRILWPAQDLGQVGELDLELGKYVIGGRGVGIHRVLRSSRDAGRGEYVAFVLPNAAGVSVPELSAWARTTTARAPASRDWKVPADPRFDVTVSTHEANLVRASLRCVAEVMKLAIPDRQHVWCVVEGGTARALLTTAHVLERALFGVTPATLTGAPNCQYGTRESRDALLPLTVSGAKEGVALSLFRCGPDPGISRGTRLYAGLDELGTPLADVVTDASAAAGEVRVQTLISEAMGSLQGIRHEWREPPRRAVSMPAPPRPQDSLASPSAARPPELGHVRIGPPRADDRVSDLGRGDLVSYAPSASRLPRAEKLVVGITLLLAAVLIVLLIMLAQR